MSVEVKAPSPFEQRPSFSEAAIPAEIPNTSNDKPRKKEFIPPNRNLKKRRASEPAPHIMTARRGRAVRGRRVGIGRLQNHMFLMGGTINDPLNLNSLNDAAISAIHNAVTPKSSPLPTPSRAKVQIMIPKNINDPLNLNSGEDVELEPLMSPNKRKRKHNRKRKSTDTGIPTAEDAQAVAQASAQGDDDVLGPLNLEIPSDEPAEGFGLGSRRLVNAIVSPVVPQTSPMKRKRKRSVSESAVTQTTVSSSFLSPLPPTAESKKLKPTPSPCKQKPKKQPPTQPAKPKQSKGNRNANFIHGNYNRYYGKRLPDFQEQDARLLYFNKDWFKNKEVLDIGCNIGHITLTVARDFKPRKIVGMDIDGRLVAIAKKNVRHYVSLAHMKNMHKEFPYSCATNYGPIKEQPLPETEHPEFPENVSFVQANYVLNEELVDMQREEYDCIMALSVTKWVHLNNGDRGIKLFFKRIYNHLRPGGKFILEPQGWSSYKRKKKLTPKIFQNFQSIRFRPDSFSAYLVSPEVGFMHCDLLQPQCRYKGFQRAILVFTKPYSTPQEVTESRGVTPLMEIHCQPPAPGFDHLRYTPTAYTPTGYTPSRYTPTGNTPSYMWAGGAPDSNPTTPRGGSGGVSTSQNCSPAGTTAGLGLPPYPQHKYPYISGDPRGVGGHYTASPSFQDSPGHQEELKGSVSGTGVVASETAGALDLAEIPELPELVENAEGALDITMTPENATPENTGTPDVERTPEVSFPAFETDSLGIHEREGAGAEAMLIGREEGDSSQRDREEESGSSQVDRSEIDSSQAGSFQTDSSQIFTDSSQILTDSSQLERETDSSQKESSQMETDETDSSQVEKQTDCSQLERDEIENSQTDAENSQIERNQIDNSQIEKEQTDSSQREEADNVQEVSENSCKTTDVQQSPATTLLTEQDDAAISNPSMQESVSGSGETDETECDQANTGSTSDTGKAESESPVRDSR